MLHTITNEALMGKDPQTQRAVEELQNQILYTKRQPGNDSVCTSCYYIDTNRVSFIYNVTSANGYACRRDRYDVIGNELRIGKKQNTAVQSNIYRENLSDPTWRVLKKDGKISLMYSKVSCPYISLRLGARRMWSYAIQRSLNTLPKILTQHNLTLRSTDAYPFLTLAMRKGELCLVLNINDGTERADRVHNIDDDSDSSDSIVIIQPSKRKRTGKHKSRAKRADNRSSAERADDMIDKLVHGKQQISLAYHTMKLRDGFSGRLVDLVRKLSTYYHQTIQFPNSWNLVTNCNNIEDIDREINIMKKCITEKANQERTSILQIAPRVSQSQSWLPSRRSTHKDRTRSRSPEGRRSTRSKRSTHRDRTRNQSHSGRSTYRDHVPSKQKQSETKPCKISHYVVNNGKLHVEKVDCVNGKPPRNIHAFIAYKRQ